MPEGDARSSLFRLKDYPKSANAAVIKGDIVRLRLIEELLDTGAGSMISIHRSFANWASSGAATMRGDLRRFAKPKRDALVACYLVEARKTLLDQIVEMNDLFLISMNRRSRNAVENAAQESAPPRPRRTAPCARRASMRWLRPTARK